MHNNAMTIVMTYYYTCNNDAWLAALGVKQKM